MKDYIDLLARFCIAFIFLYEAYDSIVFFKHTKETMTDYGIVWNQNLLLGAVIFSLILGSILILIGYYASIGGFLILLYWIPFTFIIYSFWNDPLEFRRLHSLYFMRNLGTAAALLLLMANGAGKFSVRRVIHSLRLPEE
ncbi:MAG: putative oxidoreductase [Saprospiraceae bacterium]|jgi:putative oxidoreductase